MAFVFEKVPEKDYEFFKSMGLKNCWGNGSLSLSKDTKWCADRDRNAYLVRIGGGFNDMPNFHDFWWDGYTIRIEVVRTSTGNYDDGINITWNIMTLPIPNELWEKQTEILKMINEAFSIDLGWCEKEEVRSVNVKIMCEPEIVEGK